MRLRSIILAAAGCLLSLAAQAQPIQGFYIGAGAGLRFPFPTKATSLEPGVAGRFDINQKLGYDTQLSVGYALGNGWRFELEGTLGRSAIKSLSEAPFPGSSAGSVRNTGVMVNAVFDLDVRSRYVYPYIGLGFGYQFTRLDGFTETRADKPGAFSASGTKGAPAAQAIVGLSFPIPNMPGLSVTLDYRIMDILGGAKYSGTSTIGLPAGSAPVAGSIKMHNQFDQTTLFGVRYAFNTPPPAAVASTAEAAPRPAVQTYEVAFDPDRTALTGRAQRIVRAAALAASRPGTTRIAVTGGDNDVAGARDRQTLSGQRATIVVAALVAEGVPRDEISVQSAVADMGDDRTPLGQTGDRRVEIVTR